MVHHRTVELAPLFAGIGLALVLGLAIFFATGQGKVAQASPGDCQYGQIVHNYVAGGGFLNDPNIFDDPSKALGFPDGEFVALGNGGRIVLKLDLLQDGPGPDIRIWETVGDLEGATVYVSENGINYVEIGNTSGAVLEEGINYLTSLDIGNDDGANYPFVKIVDDNADNATDILNPGFDLNSIAATNCGETPPDVEGTGRFTGGGHQIRIDDVRVTRGLTIHCDLVLSNNLEVNWNGNSFHMTEHLTTVECTDHPDIIQAPPPAPLDTLIGVGTGRYNGVDGFTIEFTLVDAGEPGTEDQASLLIYETADPANVVLDVPLQVLTGGNLQAHYDQPHK